jgi:polyisoprenoid-binding protein YceI
MPMRKAIPIILMALAGDAANADTFAIDPNHTWPLFEVNHLGFTTQRGRFDKTSGKIQLDMDKKTGAVDLTIDADSINMGLAKWNEHLKSADFFNVAQFPSIRYQSDKLIFQGNTPVAAEGALTLLGVTKPLKVTIQRFSCGINPINLKRLCAADIEAVLKRSEFGMTKYLPAVGDEVKVLAPVEAYRE